MEFNTNFKENPHFHQSFSLGKPSKPQMENGFSIGSSPSKGLYQNLTNFDLVSNIENAFSNFSFGIFTPFYDPFDPFQASSSPSDQSANFFPMSEPKNPLGSNGDQKIGLSSYSPRILLQALNYTGQNFQPFQQMHPNLSDEASCLTVEDKYRAKVDSKKKKKDLQPKESKKVYQNYPILVKGQWTPEEDRLLVQLVKLYGERKWSHIAEMLNGRVGKQCRERWHNHLRPDIKKDIWTEEEEMMLIEAHRKIGNKWAAIARKMPGRTENTVKNHWNATKRRRLNTAKRSKCKHTSILHEYIMSLTAPDQNRESEPKNQMDQATNFDSDHHNHKAADFGSKVFDEVLPAELGSEVGLGVINKEMDLLEMVYQGIF